MLLFCCKYTIGPLVGYQLPPDHGNHSPLPTHHGERVGFHLNWYHWTGLACWSFDQVTHKAIANSIGTVPLLLCNLLRSVSKLLKLVCSYIDTWYRIPISSLPGVNKNLFAWHFRSHTLLFLVQASITIYKTHANYFLKKKFCQIFWKNLRYKYSPVAKLKNTAFTVQKYWNMHPYTDNFW